MTLPAWHESAGWLFAAAGLFYRDFGTQLIRATVARLRKDTTMAFDFNAAKGLVTGIVSSVSSLFKADGLTLEGEAAAVVAFVGSQIAAKNPDSKLGKALQDTALVADTIAEAERGAALAVRWEQALQ